MFSLKWFTTIPGLLITGGVLLLVVALVIFIVTSKKDKKNKKAEESAGVATIPNSGVVTNPEGVGNLNVSNQPNGVIGQPAMGMDSISIPAPGPVPTVPNVQPPTLDSVPVPPSVMEVPTAVSYNVPGMSSMPNSASNPEISPVPTPDITIGEVSSVPGVLPVQEAVPVIDPQPVVSIAPTDNMSQINEVPVNTPNISEVPTVSTAFNASNNTSNVVTPSVEQVIPELQDVGAPTINTTDNYSSPYSSDGLNTSVSTTPIYGGSDPTISNLSVTETPQIYGGANPLEGTQSVPINDIANSADSTMYSPAPPVSVPVTDPVVVNPVPAAPSVVEVNSVSPTITTVPEVPTVNVDAASYVAQAPVVNEPVNSINNNFAYQSATAPQIQLPNDHNV